MIFLPSNHHKFYNTETDTDVVTCSVAADTLVSYSIFVTVTFAIFPRFVGDFTTPCIVTACLQFCPLPVFEQIFILFSLSIVNLLCDGMND